MKKMTQLEINHPEFKKPKHAVVSLSGGMDSSTLLLKCLNEFESVTALSFDYGQKHKVELKRARALVDYLKRNGHNVTYQVIELNGLVSLLNSALVEGGDDVPEGHYEQDNMKETVVPNRNKMFSSITQAVALSVANKTKSPVKIAMGIHAGDHAIYPDCRQEFRDADYNAFVEGNWDAEWVTYYTPYLEGDKLDILKDGEKLCKKLNIDFDEVYARTNTSYKPTPEGWSDYKSASSVERIEAFIKLGRPDPVQYADETGAVEYEVAETHVKKLLNEYEKENR
jgi:7-cyano-7-deazaguanine synthase